MDGENNGKALLEMDDLGGKPTIFGNIHILNDLREVFPCLYYVCPSIESIDHR